MFDALSRWRRRRILSRAAIPDALWREALARLPFLALYGDGDLLRLHEKVVLFLDAKAIVGASGHAVTALQRVVIAIQACVLVLELDLALYDGFEAVQPADVAAVIGAAIDLPAHVDLTASET